LFLYGVDREQSADDDDDMPSLISGKNVKLIYNDLNLFIVVKCVFIWIFSIRYRT